MQKIDPVGSNFTLHSVYSNTFISPDVVMAYEAVLETDRMFLAGLEKEQIAYVMAMLSFLAPNDESRLANFGRSTAQEDKRHKKGHFSSGSSSSSGRRTKPVGNKPGGGGSKILSSNLVKKVIEVINLLNLYIKV